MVKLFKKLWKKFKLRERVSKGERLIYIVIFLWILFGILGILKSTNLTQLAGYYASLTIFISTYLWGEYKRASKTTPLYMGGPNSSREVVIYLTVFLWAAVGIFGIFYMTDLNPLTVYFGALSPFVMSYIIYKTSAGDGDFSDLPIFDGKSQELVDNAKDAADIKKVTEKPKKVEPKKEVPKVITEEPKDKVNFTGFTPEEDDKDVTEGI
jgi:hypothetical protein